ncbi:MAG: nucleotidyltransferase domain-containing protein [Patescibacteria group bacterium]
MIVNKEKIQEITNKIVKEYNPRKIILFGSYAWGKPTEDSDVDLFIIKDSFDRRIERER